MRALQLVEYGQFRVVERAVPGLGKGDVLVRVRTCGICGSDVHGMDGSTGRRIPPVVMGHEAAGEIVDVGTEVEGWLCGDRVTFDSTLYCGHCPFCLRGQVNLCDNRQVIGVSCAEYRRDGAFAEYVSVPARVLYRIPEQVSDVQAAMVEPVAVALHAVSRAGVSAGQSVAVIGAGMIGLLVVQVLKAKGAYPVTAVDIDPLKLEKAASLGADHACSSSLGLELDAVIEAVGISQTVDMALRSVRKGGTVALVGNLNVTAEIPLQVVVTRELSIFGCCASQGNYQEALDLIAHGVVKVDSMISATCSLEEAPGLFQRLYGKEPGLMKVMVCP